MSDDADKRLPENERRASRRSTPILENSAPGQRRASSLRSCSPGACRARLACQSDLGRARRSCLLEEYVALTIEGPLPSSSFREKVAARRVAV